MDTAMRLKNADEQSRELLRTFTALDHRIATCVALQADIHALQATLATVRTELEHSKRVLQQIQAALPTVARKEEFERVSQKVNAIPFESLATQRDI
jgi:hypothetical protein